MQGREASHPLTRVRPADLRRLRWGQTVSMFGDRVTSVALPTVALLLLNATPFQFGLLTASTYLPYPVLGLFAGAWVDRIRRRRVLVLADASRFVAIGSIPVAAISGTLSFAHLFVVGLLVGTASVFFNSAYQAYLPSIVRPEEITSANAKLSISETSAQVGGPAVAGLLISVLGAAGALLVDALSFLASIVGVTFIRRPEQDPRTDPHGIGGPRGTSPDTRSGAAGGPDPSAPASPRRRREQRPSPRSGLLPDVMEGLRVVFGDRLLRGLALTSALSNLGRALALELFLLFAYKGLLVSPGVAGTMLAAGNIGSLAGSLGSQRLMRRLGIGPTLILGSVMKGLPWVLAPLALLGGAIPVSVAILMASSFFVPISNVATVSMRQSLVSRQIQGRVAATTRTLTRTVVPLAAILGGGLAQFGTSVLGPQLGLASVLVLGGVLWMGATVMLPRDRLRGLRSLADLRSAEPDGDRSKAEPAPVPPDSDPPPESLSPAPPAAAPLDGYAYPANGHAHPANGHGHPLEDFAHPVPGHAANGHPYPANGHAYPANGHARPNNGYANGSTIPAGPGSGQPHPGTVGPEPVPQAQPARPSLYTTPHSTPYVLDESPPGTAPGRADELPARISPDEAVSLPSLYARDGATRTRW